MSKFRARFDKWVSKRVDDRVFYLRPLAGAGQPANLCLRQHPLTATLRQQAGSYKKTGPGFSPCRRQACKRVAG
jgi:hypothetical protein